MYHPSLNEWCLAWKWQLLRKFILFVIILAFFACSKVNLIKDYVWKDNTTTSVWITYTSFPHVSELFNNILAKKVIVLCIFQKTCYYRLGILINEKIQLHIIKTALACISGTRINWYLLLQWGYKVSIKYINIVEKGVLMIMYSWNPVFSQGHDKILDSECRAYA